MSAASLQALAGAALAVLAREGARSETADGPVWRAGCVAPGAEALEITCAGPSLPVSLPAEIATPEQVMGERPWQGACRLVVRAAGLIVLDLYWNPGQPARIMGFSRGDWERGLIAAPSPESA